MFHGEFSDFKIDSVNSTRLVNKLNVMYYCYRFNMKSKNI